MPFLQDPSFFTMGMWSIGAGALGAAALALLLANTDVFLSKPQKAALEYLEDIELKTLEKEPRTLKAKELWEKNGAVIMAVRRPGCFLCREVSADEDLFREKDPGKRKMMFMGFIRLGVWYNFFRAWNGGFSGNLEGEGFILGGVFVVGSGKQGILLEHREKEFGDKVNLLSVLEAAKMIKPQTLASEKK
uniref:Peroxiredoxin-like 2A n=1 Tax=Nomascus leucogenys TaxID=61853 RepID=G1RIH0_NOMLE